jgi:hypothetical protein
VHIIEAALTSSSRVICYECGTVRRVLVRLAASDLCLDCLKDVNKTVAAWKKERHDYILANSRRMNARVLDEAPHQVRSPNES